MKRNLFMCIVLLMALNVYSQVPSYVPTSGLVGWYPFTGNANDYSINMNNGIVYGSVLTTDRFGNINSSYNFNGISDYIETPIIQSIDSSYSLSMWFNTINGGWMFRGSKDCVGGVGSRLNMDSTITYGSDDNGYFDGTITSNSFNDGIWHHVVGVWDGSGNSLMDPNQFLLYVDGVLVLQNPETSVGHGGSGGHRSIPMSGTSNCCFGELPCMTGGNNFNGKLDDIGIWNRPLTPSEITSLYNGSSTGINEIRGSVVKIFPNPCVNILNVMGGKDYKIYDVMGKLILSGNVFNSTQIDLSGLDKGLYFLQVNNLSYKIIKD